MLIPQERGGTSGTSLAVPGNGTYAYSVGNQKADVVVMDGDQIIMVEHPQLKGPVSVDRSGNRVLIDNSAMFGPALSGGPYGRIGGFWPAIVSRDGTRALAYVDTLLGARINVYNTNVPADAGGNFPLITSIPIADRAGNCNFVSCERIRMVTTTDDKVLFVAGDQQILVVPLAP